jgi:hypothetical protein
MHPGSKSVKTRTAFQQASPMEIFAAALMITSWT